MREDSRPPNDALPRVAAASLFNRLWHAGRELTSELCVEAAGDVIPACVRDDPGPRPLADYSARLM